MSDQRDDDKPGLGKKGLAVIGGIASAVYLLNIPALPPDLLLDAFPIVGNLDELVASAMFLWSTRTLGLKPMGMLKAARERKRLKAATKELSDKA